MNGSTSREGLDERVDRLERLELLETPERLDK